MNKNDFMYIIPLQNKNLKIINKKIKYIWVIITRVKNKILYYSISRYTG